VNFARDVVDARRGDDLALLELSRDGGRREWSFAEVSAASGALAGHLVAAGVQRGDVVMTLIGNRPDWALAMVACLRIGAVVLPCAEQQRAKDLALRLAITEPRLILADERNRAELEAAGPSCTVLTVPDEALRRGEAPPFAELAAEDPCLLTFTSGTEGQPKAVLHAQRYLPGQVVQATHWLGAREGDLVWSTAASGWSKSARNAFLAPWLKGGAGVLHDGRFDPEQRLELVARERIQVLCMAPTEYRIIAKRAQIPRLPGLRRAVAAGEALNPEVLGIWSQATGLTIRDGGRAGAARLDGAAAARRQAVGRGRRAGARSRDRAHVLLRLRRA
jgi:acyl-coenzyme A synthetase/AMP-(fatty) acid ligase